MTDYIAYRKVISVTAMWLDAQAEFTTTTNKQALLFDMSITLFLAW
jgi:hypothetical protein